MSYKASHATRIVTSREGITLGTVKNEMDNMIRKALQLVRIPRKVRAKGCFAEETYLCKSMGRELPNLWVQSLAECRI